jgi:DNA-binding PadR family transcriptional regulator
MSEQPRKFNEWVIYNYLRNNNGTTLQRAQRIMSPICSCSREQIYRLMTQLEKNAYLRSEIRYNDLTGLAELYYRPTEKPYPII